MLPKYLHPITAHIEFKKLAKAHKQAKCLTQTLALEQVAREHGFPHWHSALTTAKQTETLLKSSLILVIGNSYCTDSVEKELARTGFINEPQMLEVIQEQLFQELKADLSIRRTDCNGLLNNQRIYICHSKMQFQASYPWGIEIFCIVVKPSFRWIDSIFRDNRHNLIEMDEHLYIDSFMDFDNS